MSSYLVNLIPHYKPKAIIRPYHVFILLENKWIKLTNYNRWKSLIYDDILKAMIRFHLHAFLQVFSYHWSLYGLYHSNQWGPSFSAIIYGDIWWTIIHLSPHLPAGVFLSLIYGFSILISEVSILFKIVRYGEVYPWCTQLIWWNIYV